MFNLNAGLRASLSGILVMSMTSQKGKFELAEVIKRDTPFGTRLSLEELAPPDRDTTPLAEVAAFADAWNPQLHSELVQKDVLRAPPLRATDRIVVFLRKPGVPPEYDLGNPKASVIGCSRPTMSGRK